MNDDAHAGPGRYTLKPEAGGLQVRSGEGVRFAIRRERSGWVAEGGEVGEFRLSVAGSGGLVLAGPGESSRATTFSPAGPEAGPVAGGTILTADGDLFVVQDRAGQDAGYDLVGWQGGGAYFASSGSRDRWQLLVHPAGEALLGEDRGKAVLLMFVAAISGLAPVGA